MFKFAEAAPPVRPSTYSLPCACTTYIRDAVNTQAACTYTTTSAASQALMTLDSDSGTVGGDRSIRTDPPSARKLPIPSSLTFACHFSLCARKQPVERPRKNPRFSGAKPVLQCIVNAALKRIRRHLCGKCRFRGGLRCDF